jgi:hypothetical protein
MVAHTRIPGAHSFSRPSRKGHSKASPSNARRVNMRMIPFVPGEATQPWVERSRGAVPMVCTRSLPVAVVAAAARNVGAHSVTGEKPDNQAETGCPEGKRHLLVLHGDPRSLRGFDQKRLPLTQISSLSGRHCCGTAERGDLAPGSLRVAIRCWLAVTSGSPRYSKPVVPAPYREAISLEPAGAANREPQYPDQGSKIERPRCEDSRAARRPRVRRAPSAGWC